MVFELFFQKHGTPIDLVFLMTQVLELGIVAHSVIIGISLGASESPQTIKPLVAALTFHQFFEGMGLGSCIVQVYYFESNILIFSIFFLQPEC